MAQAGERPELGATPNMAAALPRLSLPLPREGGVSPRESSACAAETWSRAAAAARGRSRPTTRPEAGRRLPGRAAIWAVLRGKTPRSAPPTPKPGPAPRGGGRRPSREGRSVSRTGSGPARVGSGSGSARSGAPRAEPRNAWPGSVAMRSVLSWGAAVGVGRAALCPRPARSAPLPAAPALHPPLRRSGAPGGGACSPMRLRRLPW